MWGGRLREGEGLALEGGPGFSPGLPKPLLLRLRGEASRGPLAPCLLHPCRPLLPNGGLLSPLHGTVHALIKHLMEPLVVQCLSFLVKCDPH